MQAEEGIKTGMDTFTLDGLYPIQATAVQRVPETQGQQSSLNGNTIKSKNKALQNLNQGCLTDTNCFGLMSYFLTF